MRNFFVLTYDSDDDAAEVVADYEMGGFDLTTFWTGSPFAGTIPDDVALFVRDGHPSDYLANPISWPIVSDRFRELIEQMDPPSTQFLDVPLYRVGTRERVRGYWLANITRCLPVVVPGKGGVKELQVDLLVLAGDRIPPEIQIFRLQESSTLELVSEEMCERIRELGFRGTYFIRTQSLMTNPVTGAGGTRGSGES